MEIQLCKVVILFLLELHLYIFFQLSNHGHFNAVKSRTLRKKITSVTSLVMKRFRCFVVFISILIAIKQEKSARNQELYVLL